MHRGNMTSSLNPLLSAIVYIYFSIDTEVTIVKKSPAILYGLSLFLQRKRYATVPSN